MNSLRRTVEKYSMLKSGDSVLCALSAGADSTCMTHILAEYSKHFGISVAAAHFSHGLRPEMAEKEKKMAEGLCDSLKIPFFFGENDTFSYAKRHHLGLEEGARELRYAFLRKTLAQWRPDGKIATAHNLGDQAETVLFNLARGAGMAGIKGIAPVSGNIIRPLIEAPREEIIAYLEERKLDYSQDETNNCKDFARNRIRHEILPLLSRVNEKYLENIAKAGFFAGEALEFIDQNAQKMLHFSQNRVEISQKELQNSPNPLQIRAISLAYFALRRAGLYQNHMNAVLALARSNNPSAMVNLPQNITARREYGKIIFENAQKTEIPPPQTVTIGQTTVWGGWRVAVSAKPAEGSVKIPACAVTPPLTVRARAPGDAILTQGGTKTLKKLMIDRKIPKNLRDMTPVLCDNMGVLCVAGCGLRACEQSCGEYIYITFEKVGDEI